MPDLFRPHPWQLPMIEHILAVPRCALWAGMGMGKTSAALSAIDILLLSGEINPPILIVAPLRVANKTWPDEVTKWTMSAGLTLCNLTGHNDTRRLSMLRRDSADIYTINYEHLPWLVDALAPRWPFSMVVADESTRLKGFRLKRGGRRAWAMGKIAHRSTRWVNLTGTPAPNGFLDLWGQQWFVDRGERLGRTYTAFRNRWFRKSYDGHSYDLLPHAESEITSRLADVCTSLEPAEWFDLKQPILRDIIVDLPPRARRLYDEMEKKFFIDLGDVTAEAVHAGAKSQKCLQIASGGVYANVEKEKTEWRVVHDEKIEALKSIVEESCGAPIIVAYYFKPDLKRLLKAFPKARALDKNTKTQDDWNAGKIPILLAHPASAGHGLNLQDGGNILVFYSINWNLEHYAQIIERIGPTRQMQAGHDRPVFIYRILARNTFDFLVKERLETKRSVEDILMDRMKAKGHRHGP